MEENKSDIESRLEAIEKRQVIIENRLNLLSITPTFSVCCDHGYIAGEEYECPFCGKDTEVYSRIVGYYRPVKNWNTGKSKEYKDRVVFEVDAWE